MLSIGHFKPMGVALTVVHHTRRAQAIFQLIEAHFLDKRRDLFDSPNNLAHLNKVADDLNAGRNLVRQNLIED